MGLDSRPSRTSLSRPVLTHCTWAWWVGRLRAPGPLPTLPVGPGPRAAIYNPKPASDSPGLWGCGGDAQGCAQESPNLRARWEQGSEDSQRVAPLRPMWGFPFRAAPQRPRGCWGKHCLCRAAGHGQGQDLKPFQMFLGLSLRVPKTAGLPGGKGPSLCGLRGPCRNRRCSPPVPAQGVWEAQA